MKLIGLANKEVSSCFGWFVQLVLAGLNGIGFLNRLRLSTYITNHDVGGIFSHLKQKQWKKHK